MDKEIKLEPEVIICHNNDDVELAFDPFADADIDFPVGDDGEGDGVEEIDCNFGIFDAREQVRIVNIKTTKTSDTSDDDFLDAVDFHNNSYNSDDDDYKPSTDTEIKLEPNDVNEDANTADQIDSPDRDPDAEAEEESDYESEKMFGKKVKQTNKPKVKRKKGRPKSDEEHKCKICGKLFPYASSLRVHERTHLPNKGFNCPVEDCKKSFARSDHCKHHINTVHKGQVIDGVLRVPTFEQKCSICLKIFYHAGNLRTHLKLHAGERIFKCEDCSKTFVLAQHLKSHIQIVHTNLRREMCSICGKIFNHIGNFRKHMKIHEGIKPFSCSICNKQFGQSSNYKNHMKVHLNDRPYKCEFPECHRSFVQPNNLILHQRVHSGEKPFSCEVCSRAFRLKSQLSSHNRTHTGEKPYSCMNCGKAFSSRSLLRIHEKTHSDNSVFKCTYCQKSYSFSHLLQIHIRTHTGEKPYLCPVSNCDEAFASGAQRNRHIRSRHVEATEKKVKDFPCGTCGRIFHCKRLLSNHIKIHEGIREFKCEYCTKAFITKSDKNKHERVHTGVKPYTCELCQRQFTFSNSYRIHMRNHAGEKPFECKWCGKRFSCSSDRGKHVRSHERHTANFNSVTALDV